MDKRQEEAHYFHTIADVYEMMEMVGEKQFVHDLEASSALLYQMLESAVLERHEKRKTAALFAYNEAFFGTSSETNN